MCGQRNEGSLCIDAWQTVVLRNDGMRGQGSLQAILGIRSFTPAKRVRDSEQDWATISDNPDPKRAAQTRQSSGKATGSWWG